MQHDQRNKACNKLVSSILDTKKIYFLKLENYLELKFDFSMKCLRYFSTIRLLFDYLKQTLACYDI